MNITRRLEGQGVALYRAAEAQGLERTVAKRKDSRYYFDRRTKDWIKCKNLLDEDFVVCGFYFKADNLISVVLGSYGAHGPEYQGHVVMGVSRNDYRQTDAAPKTGKAGHYAAFPDFDGVVWLKPVLVCKVQYMERTAHGSLRQPVYRGLRDEAPADCRTQPPAQSFLSGWKCCG